MNVFVAVTLEYWTILKQKRGLKTRVQLPRDWFGTLIWPSCHGQGSQFLFFEEEKDLCLTGEERGGNEMKNFPTSRSPLRPHKKNKEK